MSDEQKILNVIGAYSRKFPLNVEQTTLLVAEMAKQLNSHNCEGLAARVMTRLRRAKDTKSE